MDNTDQLFYFQWHITDKCNLRCKHCYQSSYTEEKDLPLTKLIEISNEFFITLDKWGKYADISVTGGEPFLRNDLFDFLRFLDSSKRVKNFDILTNGILIDDNKISILKGFSKLKYIQISLDGSCPEVHDKIRGRGTFLKAISSIRKLISSGYEVRLMFTLQNQNKLDIEGIINLSIDEGISGLTIERMVPLGASKDSFNKSLSKEEIKDIFKYVVERSDQEYKKNSKLKILKYRPLWILVDPCRQIIGENPYTEIGSICSIGLDNLCVLPDASVLACRRLPITVGNLLIDSFEKIWTRSDLLWKICDKSLLKGKCHNCEHISRCGGCRAMAYAYSGDYLSEDPHCWLELNS